jgi:hypothetical protein
MNYEEELERRLNFARERAAQCWCTPETQSIEMDVVLAEAFAQILVEEMYQPRLGCATTRELLSELAARSDLDYAVVSPLSAFPHEV